MKLLTLSLIFCLFIINLLQILEVVAAETNGTHQIDLTDILELIQTFQKTFGRNTRRPFRQLLLNIGSFVDNIGQRLTCESLSMVGLGNAGCTFYCLLLGFQQGGSCTGQNDCDCNT